MKIYQSGFATFSKKIKSSNYFKLSTLLVLLIFISSCTKEDNENNTKGIQQANISIHHKGDKNIASSYDWLHFNSLNDYVQTLSNLKNATDDDLLSFENTNCFQSMRHEIPIEIREKMGIDDDLLATLLNPDGIIQIGQYIFKIDIPNNITYVYDVNNSYSQSTYDIDDNVLNILYGFEEPSQSKDNDDWKKTIEYNGTTKVNCKIVYQRAAIYFSLLVKINKPTSISSPGVYISYNALTGSYTKNRANASQQTITGKAEGGTNNSYSYRPYSEMCGLKQFNWTSDFYISDALQSNSVTYRLTIFK